MGKYLDIIRCVEAERTTTETTKTTKAPEFGRIGRFGRTFSDLEGRCPEHVDLVDWHCAIEDGRRFLAQWGEQAEALGWTVQDLFGLAPMPERPRANYRRVSRLDGTGLIWLLRGRPVIALTEFTAAIQADNNVMTYRRRAEPNFEPEGRFGTQGRTRP